MRPHRRALALPPMRRDASVPRNNRSSSSIIGPYISNHTSIGVHTTSIVAPSNFCVSSFTAASPRCLTLWTIGSTCNANGHMQHLRVVTGLESVLQGVCARPDACSRGRGGKSCATEKHTPHRAEDGRKINTWPRCGIQQVLRRHLSRLVGLQCLGRHDCCQGGSGPAAPPRFSAAGGKLQAPQTRQLPCVLQLLTRPRCLRLALAKAGAHWVQTSPKQTMTKAAAVGAGWSVSDRHCKIDVYHEIAKCCR